MGRAQAKAKIKTIAIATAVGLAIGIVATSFAISAISNHGDSDTGPAPSVVFTRVVQKSELVTASQRYNITEKVTKTASFFDLFDIPFTTNSFWYRYVGEIKAGVNLENAEFSQSIIGDVITITIDQPYIISNTPNMNESGVLEENNNVLNPIHIDAVDEFQRQCVETSQTEAIEGGLFDEARANAEQDIRDMFNAALGDGYSVEFAWRNA